MLTIRFRLDDGGDFAAMAPPAVPGGFGAAALPAGLAGGGIYMIVNGDTDNRYVGISTDLAKRFKKRLEVVTELGFSVQQMSQIGAYWGVVEVRDAPTPANPFPQWVQAMNYSAPFEMLVAGHTVNLERLLIRFCLEKLGVGGTVSNNMLAFHAYDNPTPNAIRVELQWAGPGLFAPDTRHADWIPGQPW